MMSRCALMQGADSLGSWLSWGLKPLPSLAPLAALVSRQYVDMSRIRIEGLLAAFPKLVGTGKQHTYVETENVRYVYQPMEVSAAASQRGCMLVLCI